ncbi:MAG: ComEC/Rec2 family competence protein, partial [Candidatus Komeilibacteria bacterium]|nr:ComEC/Rec2 family competence protein [Candidatus Komeilibacteria bacterium]
VLHNPFSLLYDIGWQLSFLAVLGLVLWARSLQRLVSRWQKSSLWQIVTATLAAQILTLPLILKYFGILSFVAPLTNVLVLPLLPIIMGLAVAAVAVTAIVPTLGSFLFYAVQLLVNNLVEVSDFLAGLPLAAREEIQLGWWPIIAYYLIILILYKKPPTLIEQTA